MSDSSGKSWSSSPNAPQVPYSLYFLDKLYFAGDSAAAVLYGIVAVLFFQCMVSSFDPTNRANSRGIRWVLVVHTAVMFSIVTVSTGMGLNVLSISHIDNRAFPGNGQFPPGPIGYKFVIYAKAILLVPNLGLELNQWLADGLLLYRCYVIYCMNHWVLAVPCLIYLASLVTGMVSLYETPLPQNRLAWTPLAAAFNTSYFAVSFSLNLLLTLMIIGRLIMHMRDIQNALGASGGGQLYGTIVTILVESSALYAISFLLFFVPFVANSPVYHTFWASLVEVQVIAPFLIVKRLASQSALTSDAVSGQTSSSIRFRTLRSTSDGTLADGSLTTTGAGAHGECPRELGAGVEITAEKLTS